MEIREKLIEERANKLYEQFAKNENLKKCDDGHWDTSLEPDDLIDDAMDDVNWFLSLKSGPYTIQQLVDFALRVKEGEGQQLAIVNRILCRPANYSEIISILEVKK